MQSVKLLGIPISRLGLPAALDACEVAPGGYACFVNAHSLSESERDSALASAFGTARYCFADGMPLLWAAKLKGEPVESRVCGPDFTTAALKRWNQVPHGFIGGAPGVAEELARRFGLAKAICYSPPMRPFSSENALDDWATFLKLCPGGKAPRWIWIGLGAPKQERWMQAVSPRADGTVFFGVGAAFDFLSGKVNRAPKWMQESGLEWVHRLASEPRRLAGRYLVTNTRFVALIARELLGPARKT